MGNSGNIPLALADRVAWSASQMAADICGQTVILALERNVYCGLDEIAGDIWRRLARPISLERLCADLARDYAAPPEDIERDVRDLLDHMRIQGIIDVLR